MINNSLLSSMFGPAAGKSAANLNSPAAVAAYGMIAGQPLRPYLAFTWRCRNTKNGILQRESSMSGIAAATADSAPAKGHSLAAAEETTTALLDWMQTNSCKVQGVCLKYTSSACGEISRELQASQVRLLPCPVAGCSKYTAIQVCQDMLHCCKWIRKGCQSPCIRIP